MESSRPAGVMPLRPLTFGELLDAAVSVLRTHGRLFLGVAFVLAALEQAVLYPLRGLALMDAPWFQPYSERTGWFWLAFCAGFATEAAILLIAGAFAATAAGPALLGERLTGRQIARQTLRRTWALVGLAALVGAVAGVAALALFLPWIFVYGLFALIAPALVIERLSPGAALGRALRLGSRGGMRAAWVRLGGYLSWLAIRLALGFGGVAALDLVLPQSEGWRTLTSMVAWLLINTVAYATLGCLDAVLYLESRMRTEGLDIVLGRHMRAGQPVDLSGVLR